MKYCKTLQLIYSILNFSITSRMGNTRNAQSSQPKQNGNAGINKAEKSHAKLTGFAICNFSHLFVNFPSDPVFCSVGFLTCSYSSFGQDR